MDEVVEAPAEDEDQAPDPLLTATRVLLLAIYMVDLVVVIDLATHGQVRERLAAWWRRNVARPLARRAELRKAEAWVVWEALRIVEGAA